MNAIIDVSKTEIRTKRLLLRPFRKEDLEDFYEYAKNPKIGKGAGWNAHKSIEESKPILESFINGRKTFAIVYENHVVGSVGIEYYDEPRFLDLIDKKGREIGCVLKEELWGKGLMPEAILGVKDYLFSNNIVDFLVYAHFDWNVQSKRVAEKCGFKFAFDGVYEGQCVSCAAKYYILENM